MDLLWLLMDTGRWTPAQTAAFLLEHMRDPTFDACDRQFFRQTLPTLGARGVPLLRALVEQPLNGNREAHWPGWLAEGMRKLADTEWEAVRAAATNMFATGDPAQAETALRVFAKVDAPVLLAELHDLNLQRVRAMEEAIPDRVGLIQSKQRAFDAFARAAAGSPAWLDARMAAATDSAEAEQLLWALVQQRRGVAQPIWEARRDHLFATIREGARVLPNAVRSFADPADLNRLRLPPPEGADMLQGAVTFDAIARLDPARVLEILRFDTGDRDSLDLRGTEAWWMPGLHFRTRHRLGEALRERARSSARAVAANELARLYAGCPELLEDETVDILLDGLEAMLIPDDEPPDERLRKSYGLLSTLSSARTAATLARIVARRGSRLEAVLASLGVARPPSSSRTVDHESEMIVRLLALMAGEGFDRLTLAQLASPGSTTRKYGLAHALWTMSNEVAIALDAMVRDPGDDKGGASEDRPYHLMQALAAHGRDQGLARLIAERSPVYIHAIDIRRAQSGEGAVLAADIRDMVASREPQEGVQAVDLSHFLSAATALEVTAPLIAIAEPGDELAARLLMLHYQNAYYERALLPKLRPFLRGANANGSIAALHLTLNGDADGRALAKTWLADHD